jgi:hypothetical protein
VVRQLQIHSLTGQQVGELRHGTTITVAKAIRSRILAVVVAIFIFIGEARISLGQKPKVAAAITMIMVIRIERGRSGYGPPGPVHEQPIADVVRTVCGDVLCRSPHKVGVNRHYRL